MPTRLAAFDIRRSVLDRKQPLDEAFARFTRDLGPRDRAFVRALVSLSLRRKGGLDAVTDACLAHPLPPAAAAARHVLALGLTQVLFMGTADHAAVSSSVDLARARGLDRQSGLINAVLRRVLRDADGFRAIAADARNLPDWLLDGWIADHGADTAAAIAAALLDEPPHDVSLRDPDSVEIWAERLNATALPGGTLRCRPSGAVEDLPGFAEGGWWVQDAAAALPARLLGAVSGRRVADLCAAPGGKTLQLAAAGARVTALDRSAPRLVRLRENLARTGLSAEIVAADAAAWAPPEPFDAVLLDAPCSATGTLRRHPDAALDQDPRRRRGTSCRAGCDPRRRRPPAEAGRGSGLLRLLAASRRGDRLPRRAAARPDRRPDPPRRTARLGIRPASRWRPAHPALPPARGGRPGRLLRRPLPQARRLTAWHAHRSLRHLSLTVRIGPSMTVALPAAPASWRHCLTAVLIGLVIPAGAFGAAAVLAVAAAALIAGLSVPDRARHGRRVLLAALFHPLGLLCCLMLLAWLPSLIASPNRGETALTWVRVAGAIAGAAYLWSILDRNESLTRIARDSLILGTAVILTVSVVAILFFPEFVSLFRHSQKVSAWHRYKALASALACLIPLLAWLAWTLPGWRRIAAVRAIGPATTIILGTGSRAAVAGSFAAMLVSLGFLAARRPRLRLPILVVCGILAATTVTFLLSFYSCPVNSVGTTYCVDADTTGALGLPLWLVDYHRQHIWLFILERLPDHPWFGHGLNAIAHIPGADHLVPGLTVAFVPSHPHNWILEILAEAGIAGFVPVALVVGGMILRDALAVLRSGCPRRAARLALLCAFWGSACFNFSIWAPWWGVSFLFLFLVVSARPAVGAEPAPRMLFTVTEDFAFLSHRLPMARAAKAAG
jgi:16S rRNA (cytosine967-C5)-methyltransferase